MYDIVENFIPIVLPLTTKEYGSRIRANNQAAHIPQFMERKNRIANTPDQADEGPADEELAAPELGFANVSHLGCARDQCPQNIEKSSALWDDWWVY